MVTVQFVLLVSVDIEDLFMVRTEHRLDNLIPNECLPHGCVCIYMDAKLFAIESAKTHIGFCGLP